MIPAQRLARLPGCWRGGMRYRLSPTHPWTRYEGDDASDGDGNPCRESEPTMRSPLVQIDLTDPATIGCLAAWCREVYGLHMYASTDGGYWYVSALYPDGADVWGMSPAWRVVTEGHDTEGDAWAAAILDRLEES